MHIKVSHHHYILLKDHYFSAYAVFSHWLILQIISTILLKGVHWSCLMTTLPYGNGYHYSHYICYTLLLGDRINSWLIILIKSPSPLHTQKGSLLKKYACSKIAKISPPLPPLGCRLNRKITTFYSDGTLMTDPSLFLHTYFMDGP